MANLYNVTILNNSYCCVTEEQAFNKVVDFLQEHIGTSYTISDFIRDMVDLNEMRGKNSHCYGVEPIFKIERAS